MRRTFRDDRLQSQFEQVGYVVQRVLGVTEVGHVTALYDELRCDLTTGWHADLFSADLGYRQAVHERVGPVFAARMLPLLARHRLVSSVFVVKEAVGESSRVPMHQDWTIVDNLRFASANMVCPLVDTNADNGWLVVVPGSHRPPCRISYGPHDRLPFDGDWERMSPYLTPVPLRAGEAIIYDGRLLHASPPNRTALRRVAFSAGFIPEEAELRLHFRHDARPEELEVLDLPEDFFRTHRLGERPEGAVSRGFIPYEDPPRTEAQLDAWVRAAAGSD